MNKNGPSYLRHIRSKLHTAFFANADFNRNRKPLNGRINRVRSWVKFIKVLTCSFYAHRSQKRKKLLDLAVFFVLLGSVRVQAAHKMMVKLTPGLDGFRDKSLSSSCKLKIIRDNDNFDNCFLL